MLQYITALIKVKQKGPPLYPFQSNYVEGQVLVKDGEPVLTDSGLIPLFTEQGRLLITKEQFDAA